MTTLTLNCSSNNVASFTNNDNTGLSSWKQYVPYIDNGVSWEQYVPYIDNGVSWEQYVPHVDNSITSDSSS